MLVKKCNMCRLDKPRTEFYAIKKGSQLLRYICKTCLCKKSKETRGRNKEELRLYHKKWEKKNAKKRLSQARQWRKENPERCRSNWRRHERIPKVKTHKSFAQKIRRSIRNKNGRSWQKIIGYTIKDLMTHLEKQFKTGMTWDNYGKWHVDHVIPMSWWEFDSYEDREFKQCWALCNLQPLWASENFKKSNSIYYKESLK